MIKAIFFDCDGVLTTDARGSLTTSKNLCREVSNLSLESVLEAYRHESSDLNLGKCTLEESWQKLCVSLSIEPNPELLMKVIGNAPKNAAMFELVRILKPRYALGIFTDNSRERMNVLMEEMNLRPYFDPIIVSAAIGASKQQGTTAIYDAALAQAGVKADESVFIENQEKNLVIPAQMGMHTYFHDDTKNDIAALRQHLIQLGVDIGG